MASAEAPSRATLVEKARDIYDDLDFGAVRRWLAEHPGRKAAGYLPVYAPREIIHACGMLPVGIHGGGDRLEIIRGDAFYQSYICHLPRSVVELAQSGRLDLLSAVLFPATCDVIRNLSGVWQLLYPQIYVRYLDLPQVPEPEIAASFWREELETLRRDLGEVSGTPATAETPARGDRRLQRGARARARALPGAPRGAVARADGGALRADAGRGGRPAREIRRKDARLPRGHGGGARPRARPRASSSSAPSASSRRSA